MSQPRIFWVFVALLLLGIGLVTWSLWPPSEEPAPQPVAAAGEVPVPTRTPLVDGQVVGLATVTPLTVVVTTPDVPAINALLSPTPTASRMPTAASSATPPPTPTGEASPTAVTPTAAPVVPETAVAPTLTPLPPTPLPDSAAPLVPGYRERFGVAGGNTWLIQAVDAGLPVGAFMNWRVDPTQPLRYGVRFWHTVRLGPGGVRTDWADIDRVAAAQPGAVWIIGNEPDVVVQDNLTPQQYARLFHEVVTYIKARDPSAKIAIAGVSQPTPLRMAYLDVVLETYRQEFGGPMPIDVWTVHAFVLREEAGSWGVGIPPGMSSAGARLYEIGDHADLEIIKQNLVDFRAWMATRGYQERPLAITEYGIVMPHDYGFPPELVSDFMVRSFDYFVHAANGNGYPADGNRLVQWWFWFSLYEAEEGYGTGNLIDAATGQLTPLGWTFANYLGNR